MKLTKAFTSCSPAAIQDNVNPGVSNFSMLSQITACRSIHWLCTVLSKISSDVGLDGASERERERYLYFSVVTGTHYGTKTPPGWQPAN